MDAIKSDRLFGLLCHVKPADGFNDLYLADKIREAEDSFESELNLSLIPRKIRCEPEAGATDVDIIESAYDYDPDMFAGERWGFLQLRRGPVLSVQRMLFAYPSLATPVFTVPPEWIRLDRDFGMIRLVPTTQAAFASFNSFILSVFTGGRSIPQSLFIDYTAGLTETRLSGEFAHVVELLKRMVAVSIVADALLPASLSNSADSFSQAVSAKLQDYLDMIDRTKTRIRNRIRGIRLTVV